MKFEIKWNEINEVLDFALQPIVNIHTGVCFGYEVLLRNSEKAGFRNIDDVFDCAYEEKFLYKLDLMLREKAVKKFLKTPNYLNTKLFYNIDNRVLEMPDYFPGNTCKILQEYNISTSSICFKLSEKHEFKSFIAIKSILNLYKQQGYKIAVDDFGNGFSGLQLLYHTEPDYIKIDRFFISGIESDSRKKLFISNIVNMAHTLGILVIAEGVETEAEFYICKQIGCDLVQGYLVQRPTVNVGELCEKYDIIEKLNNKDKRGKNNPNEINLSSLENIEKITVDTDMLTVFEIFKRNKDNNFFPVVNIVNEPLGIIRENDIKDYIYSQYGKEVLLKRTSGKKLLDFVTRCTISELNSKLETILEIFSADRNSEGIIITENGKYAGFLSSKQLIKEIYEKNLEEARDQNPLTKMKGNSLINEYISESISNFNKSYIFAYFDFDNFKPFNDKYGFRLGDRAILMFADILKSYENNGSIFTGHIGGDDFFMGFEMHSEFEETFEKINTILSKFQNNVLSLYTEKDRNRNYMNATGRDGIKRRYPLLSISAGIVYVREGKRCTTIEDISKITSYLKNVCKSTGIKVASATILSK